VNHLHNYTKKQIATMLYLARCRNFPVAIEHMTFDTFINYLKIIAPDILFKAAYPFHSILLEQIFINTYPHPGASLLYNGELLYWQQEGNNQQWPAYSGTRYYWENKKFDTEAQAKKDEGPIPEGSYLVPIQRLQRRPDDLFEELKGRIFRGAWPGWERSWGDYRVWLEPQSGTNTYGRGGFSIHGGSEPGSVGCIDLVENMNIFVQKLYRYGKDMVLKVEYKK
jgi:hypothetical protein